MKMDLILPIIFAATPADASCYRVIDSSTLQEFAFFHLSGNAYHAIPKKH